MGCRTQRAAWQLFLLVQLLLLLLAHHQQQAEAAAAAAVGAQASDDVVFSSGTVPADSKGEPVSAHEGWLLTNEDAYLWYGTSQKRNVSDGSSWDWLSDSVVLYTSRDLTSWKKHSTIFTADAVPAALRQRLLGTAAGAAANGPLRLERPKVLYNSARRYYVLMASIGSLDRSTAEVVWAVSVSPFGPFKFDGARQPDGVPSWDITVAADDDGNAWLARTVPGSGIAISKLYDDFLDTTGRCALIPAPHAGSPAAAWRLLLRPVMRAMQWLFPQHQHTAAAGRMSWSAPAAAAAAAAARAAVGGSLRSGLHAAVGSVGQVARSSAHAESAVTAASQQAQQARVVAPAQAGAPCLFTYRGKWYLLVATRTGWSPSKVVLYVNDGSPCDESSWRKLPAPAHGAGASRAFDSTPAFVYAHTFVGTDKVLLVYFGDRWNPADPQGPSSASYVWLPLVPAGSTQPDSLQLLNLDSWRLGDFKPERQT